MYIFSFFDWTEGWIQVFNTLLWTPAFFAIIFLKGYTQGMILLVTFGIGIFVEPFVLYSLYEAAAFFQALIFMPIVFYFLYLHKEEL